LRRLSDKDSACLSRSFLRNISGTESQSVSRGSVSMETKSGNAGAQKKEQEYEKIKRGTGDFLARNYFCDRIFGAS
jgi:hypothetical protein